MARVIFLKFILALCTSIFVGCSGNNADETTAEENVVDLLKVDSAEINSTVLLTRRVFYRELMANGKLTACRKADLKFRTDGIISQINVKDGQYTNSGFCLAVLDTSQLRISIERVLLDLQKARLDYSDEVLRAGYRLNDTVSMATGVKAVLRLRSGLRAAEIQWKQLQDDLTKTRLIAPFRGKIANLKGRQFNNTAAYDYICTLIDDSELYVDFQVLERELPFIRASEKVSVKTFSDNSNSFIGTIVSINPMVDESGLVSVKAIVSNPNHDLLDGMSAKVMVRQAMPDQLTVPKEAVLDRQGRKVVFTLNDTLAKWNYVDIAAENSTHYAIQNGLHPGDVVIVGGNFNLAHDRPVKRASHPKN